MSQFEHSSSGEGNAVFYASGNVKEIGRQCAFRFQKGVSFFAVME
jgi:hypothetical protein